MAEQAIGKYSVDVTKKDGMKSTYFVLALSLGGAEMAVGDVVVDENGIGWQVDCCGFARVGA